MHAGLNGDEPEEWRSALVDVSTVDLVDLVERDDSVLARALRRITEEARPGEPIAGFNSAL